MSPQPRGRRFASEEDQRTFIYETADLVTSSGYEGGVEEQVRTYLEDNKIVLNPGDISWIAQIIRGRISGFGPLTPLMRDEEVRDIAVNAPDDVWVLRGGGWEQAPEVSFGSKEELMGIMTQLVAKTGQSLTRKDPVIDARLPNGGPRICAVIPPVADGGPQLTVRKYRNLQLSFVEFYQARPPALSMEMATFLLACVRARLNIIVSGGTGSGKTTLLAALLGVIPTDERLVLIEDTAEISVHPMSGERPNVVRLISERSDPQRTPAEMLRASLRMSPDRIIVGEVRGGEALTMLQAMNTGQEGSMSTIHASSAGDVLSRLETLALESGLNLPLAAIRGQIAAALDVVVHIARVPKSDHHAISEIGEVIARENQAPTVQPIFVRFSDDSFRAINRPTFWSRLAPFLPKNTKDPFSTAEGS